MKKLLLSTIIILLLSSILLISCGDGVTTTTETSVITTVTDDTTTLPIDGVFSSKTYIKKDWAGKTLNIACSTWSAEPGAPWSVIELCVDYGKESGFGTKIDASVLERQEFIKETYGVELNWINATRYAMHDALKTAELAGNINYDLALPRIMRVQSIVSNGSVYDLKDREYLDLDNPYYSKNSIEAYTAKGHTFFVDGKIPLYEKDDVFVLYFNKEILGGKQAVDGLYQKVRDGKWTWSELVTLANAAYKDDGNGLRDNNDIYGLFTASLSKFYRHFDTKQAGVDEVTGEWKITLNDGRSDDIIDAIIQANTSSWCRTEWGCIYPDTPLTVLKEGGLLFYHSTLDESFRILNNDNVGVVPFPMLNEEQERYCAFLYTRGILMCIPKITQDRQMSEYFLDVLTWTGNYYVTNAYFEQKAEHLGNDEDMEMLKSYIFPNVVYDAGEYVGWGNLIGSVLGESYKDNVNSFDEAYAKYEPEALETVAKWNEAWGAYTEE